MSAKNARRELTTSLFTVYTCPASKAAHVTLCQVANIHASNDVDVSVLWTDDSNSDVATYMVRNGTVAVGDALSVIAGGLILEAGDTIQAVASANSSADLSISVIEKDV